MTRNLNKLYACPPCSVISTIKRERDTFVVVGHGQRFAKKKKINVNIRCTQVTVLVIPIGKRNRARCDKPKIKDA